MIRLGFESHTTHGPGVFLFRLKQLLEKLDRFSAEDPDVWIQLPDRELPGRIEERRQAGKTKVIVRTGGCHCTLVHYIQKPVTLPITLLDNWASKKSNEARNALLKKNLLQADEIIFQSQFSRQITHHFIGETKPGAVIFNGIPLSLFNPEGPVDTSMSGRLNVLIAHHFRPFHRLHDAFKVLAHLKKVMGDYCHFHIVGGDDGISLKYALETAKKLHLKPETDYTLWGRLTSDYAAQVYRGCDMMLNLSYWDAAPNTIIEAMASGLPVVGAKSGAVPELAGDAGIMVDESIPLLYLPHDNFKRMPKAPISHYAAGIMNILSNLEEFRLKARLRAQNMFNMDDVANRYVDIAEQICQ